MKTNNTIQSELKMQISIYRTVLLLGTMVYSKMAYGIMESGIQIQVSFFYY
jgi:hypothetical protein